MVLEILRTYLEDSFERKPEDPTIFSLSDLIACKISICLGSEFPHESELHLRGPQVGDPVRSEDLKAFKGCRPGYLRIDEVNEDTIVVAGEEISIKRLRPSRRVFNEFSGDRYAYGIWEVRSH